MKHNASQLGASHNPAAAGERAEVLTGHVSADTEFAIAGNVQANASCLADIVERAINHAYESGYISGHNDTVEGCFNNDTAEVAKDRAAEIVEAIAAHLSAND